MEQSEENMNLKKWVNNLKEKGGDHEKLAENFEFFMMNTKEYENGGINLEDIPHFNLIERNILRLGICVGIEIHSKNTKFYEISTKDNFHLTSSREDAEEISSNNTSSNIRTITIESDMPYWKTIETLKEKSKEVGEELEEIIEWFKEIINEESETELNNINTPSETRLGNIFLHSLFFGQMWEKEVPSFNVIINEKKPEVVKIIREESFEDQENEFTVKHAREFVEIPNYYDL